MALVRGMEAPPDRPAPSGNVEAAREFAVEAARIMEADQCEDIVVLDLQGVSPICDFFVIGTGTSDRQMRAVVDEIGLFAKKRGEKPFSTAGYDEGVWIIADYVDVVIHLFEDEKRGYYDLDSLWGDSPKVDWGRKTG